MLQRILVVWNSSPAAERALRTAIALARGYDADVGVLTTEGSDDAVLERLSTEAAAADVPVEVADFDGGSAAAIARDALGHGADLLVIGRDPITAELVRLARVPILVIPSANS